ncbi:MAG: DNA-3-methyladenine glycosylase, partial [Thermoanaerobaculia bacterium]
MSRLRALPRSFYRRPAETVARELLGRYLVRRLGGERVVVRLVETEAYLGAPDRASHAWNGRRTARNESLYLAGGHAYVYLIYGLHHCLNVVTGERQVGSAVLLRAAEAVSGEHRMKRNRGLGRRLRPGDLAGGPGKLCQALAVDRRQDGLSLLRGELVVTR